MAKRSMIFDSKYFGPILGLIIALLVLFVDSSTNLIEVVELKVRDFYFDLKDVFKTDTLANEGGATTFVRNPMISDDIIIVGIESESLQRFGRWPFPRYREADLLNTLSRISNQDERERAVFLDIFFIEPQKDGFDDVLLLDSIIENDRVFLETVLSVPTGSRSTDEQFMERQKLLHENYGTVRNIQGNWKEVPAFLGVESPLGPYSEATQGYGHANFYEDADKVFRRQAMVAKLMEVIEEFPLEELKVGLNIDESNFERLIWYDKDRRLNNIEFPITEASLERLKPIIESNGLRTVLEAATEDTPELSVVYVQKVQDHFIPAITLSLALEYMNKTLDDIEVVLGEHVLIPNPQMWDKETDSWVKYSIIRKPTVFATDPETGEFLYDDSGNLIVVKEEEREYFDEIKIPIDEFGRMEVNFMGEPSVYNDPTRQTYTIRPFYGFASNPPELGGRLPQTRGLENKLVMVGPFSKGMAADEKTTPYGLMYGIEIHANALNTIIMNNFIYKIPRQWDLLIYFAIVMAMSFLSSRYWPVLTLILSIVLILSMFIGYFVIFLLSGYIVNFSMPAIGVLFSYLSIVGYRVVTEERDKKRIKSMFGKYVSPQVVDEMLDHPPELGGVDKELTVLFSDIRGFTTLSETMTPQELVSHLNIYLTAMTDIIMDYKGTLDKYVGDEIMSFWGAPLSQPDHALLACECALKQMEALHELNSVWPEEKRINIGIGLNSGIMTVGNMGSTGRMNYTLMGDNVNLGARLEGTNKAYFTNIIISEYTYDLVKDHVVARELDNIRVKGKNKPVLIYELVGMK
jgi:adenylate cyclase